MEGKFGTQISSRRAGLHLISQSGSLHHTSGPPDISLMALVHVEPDSF